VALTAGGGIRTIVGDYRTSLYDQWVWRWQQVNDWNASVLGIGGTPVLTGSRLDLTVQISDGLDWYASFELQWDVYHDGHYVGTRSSGESGTQRFEWGGSDRYRVFGWGFTLG
jgi:hypothetical protein